MVKVTDEDYYMDGYLKDALDFCVKRQEKKWDNLLIIDGMEGSGKTTMSWGIGKYWSYKTGKEFSVDNIFFDPDRLMKEATSTKNKVFIWDEAALSGLSMNWQNKIQQKLVKVLMTARSRNHFWIFICPSIFMLNKYIAYDRAFFAINVYSPDNIRRGRFKLFNRKSKNAMLDYYRASRKKAYNKFKDFYGSFTKQYCELVNNNKYEWKKDRAIKRFFSNEKKMSKEKKKLIELQGKVHQASLELDITQKEIGNIIGVTPRTIQVWGNKYEEFKEKGEVKN